MLVSGSYFTLIESDLFFNEDLFGEIREGFLLWHFIIIYPVTQNQKDNDK